MLKIPVAAQVFRYPTCKVFPSSQVLKLFFLLGHPSTPEDTEALCTTTLPTREQVKIRDFCEKKITVSHHHNRLLRGFRFRVQEAVAVVVNL